MGTYKKKTIITSKIYPIKTCVYQPTTKCPQNNPYNNCKLTYSYSISNTWYFLVQLVNVCFLIGAKYYFKFHGSITKLVSPRGVQKTHRPAKPDLTHWVGSVFKVWWVRLGYKNFFL